MKNFALLGSGRVALHLRFYFQALNIETTLWSRDGNPEFNSYQIEDSLERLQHTVARADRVVLAVSDRAVPELAARLGRARPLIHLSGALNVPGVRAAHPLMTFGQKLESPEWYARVPFVTDAGFPLSDVLPGLPNPDFPLEPELRPLYHALCSLAGNSAFLLWRQIGDTFESRLGLPRRLLTPFLQQVAANAERAGAGEFTGPVARADWTTVDAHLSSLREKPPLLAAYKGYLNLAERAGHSVPEALL